MKTLLGWCPVSPSSKVDDELESILNGV